MDQRWSHSIARIKGTNRAVGAGVLALPGIVVTCAHVVRDCTPDRSLFKGKIVKLDFPFADITDVTGKVIEFELPDERIINTGRALDVAIIAINATHKIPAPCVLSDRLVPLRTPFSAYGFPSSYEHGVLAEGILEGSDTRGWMSVVADKTMGHAIVPGFSGTPLFSGHGENVDGDHFWGIVVRSDADLQAKSAWLIPAEGISRMLRRIASPYRKLQHFDTIDRVFFHGRTGFCDQVLADKHRSAFMVLVGPSGCGKSSVMRAGILPALQRQQWQTRLVGRLRNPIADLGKAILTSGEATLPNSDQILRQIVSLSSDNKFHGLAIAVDQFEDAFPSESGIENSSAKDVLKIILDAMDLLGDRLRIVLSIRGDFLQQLMDAATGRLRHVIENGLTFVPNLSETELLAAISAPAKHFFVNYDAGLAERIVRDALRVQAPSAMLQIALDAMWPGDADGRISANAYDALKGEAATGIEGALARLADDVLSTMTVELQASLRAAMLDLVDTQTGRRRPQQLAKFEEAQQRVLRQLEESRLISIREDSRGSLVELSHDSLIDTWTTLQRWLSETRTFRAWRDSVRGRQNSELLSGHALEIALAMRADFPVELSSEQELLDLIAKSEEHSLSETREQERAREEAEEKLRMERDRALTMQSLFLAAESRTALRSGDSGTALLLALEALPNPTTLTVRPVVEEARIALRTAMKQHNEVAVLLGHEAGVRCARFDSSGTRVITGGNDGRVCLWDATTGKRMSFPRVQMPRAVTRLWLSRDDQMMLVHSCDGSLHRYELQGHHCRLLSHIHVEPHTHIHYRGDGTKAIVSPPDASRPRAWDGGELSSFEPHRVDRWLPTTAVTAMAFHAHMGCWITGHEDGSLQLWHPDTLLPYMRYSSNAEQIPIRILSCAATTPELIVVDVDGCLTKWRIRVKGRRIDENWSMYRVGGEIHGVERANISGTGNSAVVSIRDTGRRFIACLGQTQGQHNLGVVWQLDLSTLMYDSTTVFDDIRPLFRLSRHGHGGYIAVGPRVFSFSVKSENSVIPIAVMRKPVTQINEHIETGRLVIAGEDGTARIIRLTPKKVPKLEDHQLVTFAQGLVQRKLTQAQRVAHYLDEATNGHGVNDVVTPYR